jgi:hypothetical protein
MVPLSIFRSGFSCWKLGLLVLALAVFPQPAAAATAPKAAGKVYLLIIADTFPKELEKASRTDGNNMLTVFMANIPAAQLDVTLIDTALDPNLKDAAKDGLKDLVLSKLRSLPIGENDTVVFYYTGHGAFDLDGHYMDLAGRNPGTLRRGEVLAEIKAKGTQPRLTVLITDCCNVFKPAPAAPLSRQEPPRPDQVSPLFNALFF